MRVVVSHNPKPTSLADEVDQWLQIGQNLRTGEEDFVRHFGDITSLEQDLLAVSSTVFASDIVAKRGMREQVNRDMQLTIPVVNVHAFEAWKGSLERILHVLSDDNWSISFERAPGTPEPMQDWPPAVGRTLLFSGGLDSLAAAVDLLDELGVGRVQFASHITGNPVTISCQKALHNYLQEHYAGTISRVVVRTGGRNVEEAEFPTEGLEVTQRTRSFMFLSIAALAARRRGHNEIVMIAENGQMAIHVPLSAARMGAFSTHTAHPEFVARATEFFSGVLQHPIKLVNPYLYQTKAEVVAKLCQEHKLAIPRSISCWKSARVHGHCGQCVPCCIRRIALEYHDLKVDKWDRDMFNETVGLLAPQHEGKRNLSELALFAKNFRELAESELDIEYIQLYNKHFDRDQAADMYRRFAKEALTVMQRYPTLNHLL